MLVISVAMSSCGSTENDSASIDLQGSTTKSTDSRPGETKSDGGEGGGPTSTLLHEQEEGIGADSTTETVTPDNENPVSVPSSTVTGAGVLAAKGFSDFSGKRVGLIANRASVVDGRSTIDLLAEAEAVDLVGIFAPEHGLRADADAGQNLGDEIDPVTGLPVFSLYGTTREPTPEMLENIDVLVFDLQDVGARFYTYTATMGLAMEAAASSGVSFVVLDRPNPLGGHRADGGLRDGDHMSFVSQYPVPSLHGLTAGELALAIQGEGWLPGLASLDLSVVAMADWDRADVWDETGLAWVPPSPGLPTAAAAAAYPATVLFEATTLSYGRGTDHPFQQVGAPWLDGDALARSLNTKGLPGVRFSSVTFTPTAEPPNGPAAVDPQYEGVAVSGVRIEVVDPVAAEAAAVGVHLLHDVLAQSAALEVPVEVIDRGDFLDLLTGSDRVRTWLESGRSAEDIVASWDDELGRFETLVAPYLLY